MLNERHQVTKRDAMTVARIEKGVPTLVVARDLVEPFHGMARERDPAGLPTWIINPDADGAAIPNELQRS